MSYTYEYPRPMVTVDNVIFYKKDNDLEILLIKRGNEPYKDKWALPGGFVDMDEELELAALRELKEESGLSITTINQIKAYGKVGRDPRGRNISVAFYGYVDGESTNLNAGDDASDAKWFKIENLPSLAFDHSEIIEDALKIIKHT